jgi:hypothetical protein
VCEWATKKEKEKEEEEKKRENISITICCCVDRMMFPTHHCSHAPVTVAL